MNAEEYLDQYKKLDTIISNEEEEYRRLVASASGLGDFSVSERVQSSRDLHKLQNAIAKYMDLEKKIERLKAKRQSIIDTIERLPFVEYKVLYILYVKAGDFTLKDIAWEFHKSYDWAKWKKRKALKMVQQIIDKESL